MSHTSVCLFRGKIQNDLLGTGEFSDVFLRVNGRTELKSRTDVDEPYCDGVSGYCKCINCKLLDSKY